jgi:hypothetical protein
MERVQGRALYVKEIIAYLGYYATEYYAPPIIRETVNHAYFFLNHSLCAR